MGQALMAASKCVYDLDPSFLLHSFHCYFVGPMQTAPEVIFKVTRIKDGTNFCSVSVGAVQNDKVCFHCLVSFQKPESVRAKLEYCSHLMPVVPHPKDTVAISELPDEGVLLVSAQKLLLLSKHRWTDKEWPLEIYLCIDAVTAKRKLAKEPVQPKLVTCGLCCCNTYMGLFM